MRVQAGNIVILIVDGVEKIHKLTTYDIYEADQLEFKNIKGLPLTWNRAKQFGFIQNENGRWLKRNFFGFELKTSSMSGGHFTAIKYTGDNSYYVVRNNMLYVHELQNLYNAMEVLELKIEK